MDEDPQTCRHIRALAERHPRRAVTLARRGLEAAPADGPIARVWPVYTLGWALLWWERFDEARLCLRAARELFALHGRRLDVLRCDYALLLADLFQHARPDLEQDLATLAEQFEQAGAPDDAARARLYQAILFDILGRPQDAGALLEQIEPVIAGGQPTDQARWLYIRGAVAISHGDYAHAELLLAQAEQSFTALHNPLERAKCWFQQAWAALRQENLDLALASYRRAEQVFARLDLPVRLALSNKGIGLLLSRMGRYDDALQSLLKALRAFTALRRTSDIGTCHLNLGNIYFYTGQWDIALAYYSRAEALYEAAGVVGERIVVRRNRGMVYLSQARPAEARTLLAKIELEAQAISDQAELAEIWGEQAGLLGDIGQPEEAMRQYQRAHDAFVQIGAHLDAAECEVGKGWLALRQGEVDIAYACFRAAAPLVAPHPYYRWRTDYGLARCAELQNDTINALAHYRAASATVAGLRRRLVSEMASSSLYAQAQQLHNDALGLAAACGALDDMLAFSEWQRALILQRALVVDSTAPSVEYRNQLQVLQDHIARLLSEDPAADDADAAAIDSALADYGDLLLHARHGASAASMAPDVIPDVTFDLAQLRAQLRQAYNDDWTALVYTLSHGQLLIGIVTPDEMALEQTPYDETLQRLVVRAGQPKYQIHTYRDLPYLQGQSAQPWQILRELADRLLPAAVQARLHPDHRLLIVPAGPLHSLPWAALRLDQHWLVERAIVQLAPSLTIWQSLAARPATYGTSALLIGCGVFDGRAAGLPAVAEELASVVARWPGDAVRLDNTQATRAALLERSASGELAGYGLLHIASHAQLIPMRGLAAHLKLWDGDLWLPELAGLRLGGALVTLSACDGAAADALLGDEVLSLSWAFLAAGASSVLASLWPVGDQAARPFMVRFYDALRRHGDAGLALAQAQRDLILRHQMGEELWTEPLCWGSFVLTGGGHLLW
ncbi:MAG: CHAT domain-containing protein [Roseiflexaceae bacterium]